MSALQNDPPSQQLFDALADPTRRTIIELLAANGQMTASALYHEFQMTNPAVSQHLKILREADLVQVKRDAQKHLYSLKPDRMKDLEKWIRDTTELWDQRFEKLETALEQERKKMEKGGD